MIYAQFLHQKQYIVHLPYELELLLVEVWKRNLQNKEGRKICCTELIKIPRLGSPATVHKNYKFLCAEGFLTSDASGRDKRIRSIELGPKGVKYLQRMDDLIKNIEKSIDKGKK